MGGADEFGLARPPAHALGNGQCRQGRIDDTRQQLRRCLAGNALHVAQLRAAAVQLGYRDATLAGEALGCLGRLALGIKGGLHRGAIHLLGAISLLGIQSVHEHGQATGSRVITCSGIAQACFLQTLFDTVEEGLGQTLQRFGWQLFGAQFYQKILLHYSASLSLASTSSRSSALAIGKPRRARASR